MRASSKQKITTSELYICLSLMSDIGGLTISPVYSIICRGVKYRKISSVAEQRSSFGEKCMVINFKFYFYHLFSVIDGLPTNLMHL
jgi:hypothetical protein